jgi:predicted Zn-dependent protease
MAIRLDPYESRWRMFHAGILVQAGRPAQALSVIDETLALNPHSAGGVAGTACNAHLLLGQLDQAIAMCERSSGYSNSWFLSLFLAAAYANRGEMDKAAAAKANVLRTVPGLTIAELRAKDPSSAEAMALTEKYLYAGLRKVGFPEK